MTYENFKKLDTLPIYENIDTLLLTMVESGVINWGKHNQICINSIDGYEDNFTLGTGSLTLNWDELEVTSLKNGLSSLSVTEQKFQLDAKKFNVVCTQFKNTEIEKIYDALNTQFILGRVRFMKSEPKTCLTWHTDETPRIHFPLITQDGCLMVVDTEVMHMPKNTWWEVNTTKKHTAFNGSFKTRIHLVAEIFGYK